MAALIADYEQQYSILTAEITAEIGQLKRLSNTNDAKDLIKKINGGIEEGHELLEQIGLEIREADTTTKSNLINRHNCYQAELKRLKQEFTNAKQSSSTATNNGRDNNNQQFTIDLSSDFDEHHNFDESIGDEQQRRLLDNSERIERTGNRLTEGYRTILETESIGTAVLQDLSNQRETIQKSRSRLRHANEDLNRSSRIINYMIMRSIRERAIIFGVGILFIGVICLSIYFSISK